MKVKGTNFYFLYVLIHGPCTYFFFKQERLQPFKLQSNCHPGKRDWFIFLKLKITFTDSSNYRACFWRFQVQSITTLQAKELKKHVSRSEITGFKAWPSFLKMSYLGVHESFGRGWNWIIRVIEFVGNRWNRAKFYLKITGFGVCSWRKLKI